MKYKDKVEIERVSNGYTVCDYVFNDCPIERVLTGRTSVFNSLEDLCAWLKKVKFKEKEE